MNGKMDREHPSELLRAYARGEVDAAERDEISRHLDSCARCRVELRAIEVLQDDETPTLEPREQRKLHAAVARAVEPREPVLLGPHSARRGLARRFAPTLGAAALLLIVALVGISGLGGSGDEDAGGEAAGVAERDQRGGADMTERGGVPDEAPDGEQAGGDEDGTQPEPTTATDALGREGPKPRFRTATYRNSSGGWESLAFGPLLEDYTRYTARDAQEREGEYLRLMANEAPDQVRDQVISCGDRVREETEEPVLAAYGALAEVDDERGLLLSFAFSESSGGRLTEYMVWAWPVGSCSTRLEYKTGDLED